MSNTNKTRRIVEFFNDLGLDRCESLAGLQNGDIDCPEWLAIGTKCGLGWCAWDTDESDGTTKLYSFE
jgi:hypothetical protein